MASATSYDLLIWQPKEQLDDAPHKARKPHAITKDHDDKNDENKWSTTTNSNETFNGFSNIENQSHYELWFQDKFEFKVLTVIC